MACWYEMSFEVGTDQEIDSKQIDLLKIAESVAKAFLQEGVTIKFVNGVELIPLSLQPNASDVQS